MKFAVISDIHANVAALRLVLDAIRAEQGIEKIFCAGDVVGFHTSPGECIDLLLDCNVQCIAGNHDVGVTGKLGKDKFPVECWEAIEWTRKKLSRRQLSFLESLPTQTRVANKFWLMHGIFGDPYHYMVGNWKIKYAAMRLRLAGLRFGFYGHTHKQTCTQIGGSPFSRTVQAIDTPGTVAVDDRSVYMINPGTVGHPRTKDAHASFSVVDLTNGSLRFERIRYDYGAVLERTLEVFPKHKSLYKRFELTEVY